MPVITTQDVVNAYNQYLGRNPTRAELDEHRGQTVPNISEAARRYFVRDQPAPAAPAGFEMPQFNFGGFEMSDTEKRHFDLLNSQIEEQIRVSRDENARVQRRRAALDQQVRSQYGIGLEEFEAQESFRAAKTARAQGERLDKALAGELPVDPALERQIGEDEKLIRARLLEQGGPGYETSTPGIQSLAEFRKRAEELRSAARHDEIAAGIGPSAASSQFGLSMIGSENSPDTTSIAQGLQASINSRQASVQANQVRAQAMLAMAEMAQRERLAQLQADLDRRRLGIASGGGAVSPDTIVRTGRGAGAATGAVIGAVAPSLFQRRSDRNVDPFST